MLLNMKRLTLFRYIMICLSHYLWLIVARRGHYRQFPHTNVLSLCLLLFSVIYILHAGYYYNLTSHTESNVTADTEIEHHLSQLDNPTKEPGVVSSKIN